MCSSVFAYSVVGTERVEGICPAQKQASFSAEQHLHEVTAFVLQEQKREHEPELNMQVDSN